MQPLNILWTKDYGLRTFFAKMQAGRRRSQLVHLVYFKRLFTTW